MFSRAREYITSRPTPPPRSVTIGPKNDERQNLCPTERQPAQEQDKRYFSPQLHIACQRNCSRCTKFGTSMAIGDERTRGARQWDTGKSSTRQVKQQPLRGGQPPLRSENIYSTTTITGHAYAGAACYNPTRRQLRASLCSRTLVGSRARVHKFRLPSCNLWLACWLARIYRRAKHVNTYTAKLLRK